MAQNMQPLLTYMTGAASSGETSAQSSRAQTRDAGATSDALQLLVGTQCFDLDALD